jgi:hypothetical protein
MSPIVWIVIAVVVIIIIVLLIVFLLKRKKSGYAQMPQCIITGGNNTCQFVGQGKECTGNGKIVGSNCVCELGWYGTDCATPTVNWYQWLVDNLSQLKDNFSRSEDYNKNPAVFIWKLSNQLKDNYSLPINIPHFSLSILNPLISQISIADVPAPVTIANENIISAVVNNPSFSAAMLFSKVPDFQPKEQKINQVMNQPMNNPMDRLRADPIKPVQEKRELYYEKEINSYQYVDSDDLWDSYQDLLMSVN